jgi:hypothetical protein
MPNVTAILRKQAGALGPKRKIKGGMSFTAKRLVPPLLITEAFDPPSR